MQRDLDPVEELLLKWADAMRRDGDNGQDYPAKASGGFVASWIKDSQELAENADAVEIEKLNASVDSLTQPHRLIIYKRHKIGYLAWSFKDEPSLYEDAKVAFILIHCTKTKHSCT